MFGCLGSCFGDSTGNLICILFDGHLILRFLVGLAGLGTQRGMFNCVLKALKYVGVERLLGVDFRRSEGSKGVPVVPVLSSPYMLGV